MVPYKNIFNIARGKKSYLSILPNILPAIQNNFSKIQKTIPKITKIPLAITKQRKNPYEEGCYTGEDLEDVKRKWEAKKEYFSQYKKDGCRPPCIDLDTALQGFDIDNTAAYQAIEDSKALHARPWQTKEGMYRIKRQALPDVRDAPLHDDNAAASCSDIKPRWRNWDGDYAMGYQRHP